MSIPGGGRLRQRGEEVRQKYRRHAVRSPDHEARADVAGSNGAALARTCRVRAKISAMGSASAIARAVGTTPRGVRRNSGSYATVYKKDTAARSTDADDFLLDVRDFTEQDALRAELRSFVTAVATETPSVVSGEDGRAALAIGNRIMDSLQRHAELVRARSRVAEAARWAAMPAAAADPPLQVH